ncbi:MAG: hypothetical protein AB7T37_01185 [Dehalococcoidia bacterium]
MARRLDRAAVAAAVAVEELLDRNELLGVHDRLPDRIDKPLLGDQVALAVLEQVVTGDTASVPETALRARPEGVTRALRRPDRDRDRRKSAAGLRAGALSMLRHAGCRSDTAGVGAGEVPAMPGPLHIRNRSAVETGANAAALERASGQRVHRTRAGSWHGWASRGWPRTETEPDARGGAPPLFRAPGVRPFFAGQGCRR